MSDSEVFPISLDAIRDAESHSRRRSFLNRNFTDATNKAWEDLRTACEHDCEKSGCTEPHFFPSQDQYIADAARYYTAAVEDAAVMQGFGIAWSGLEEVLGSTASAGRVLRLVYEIMRATEMIDNRDMMDGLND